MMDKRPEPPKTIPAKLITKGDLLRQVENARTIDDVKPVLRLLVSSLDNDVDNTTTEGRHF
jgi:hypothetical protein